jgi:hypothetical protein
MIITSINVWYTKYEGIALNELTTILIVFDPLTSINHSLECGYCKFDPLVWPTCKYCIVWLLLLEVKIVENPIAKYNTHQSLLHILWPKCKFFSFKSLFFFLLIIFLFYIFLNLFIFSHYKLLLYFSCLKLLSSTFITIYSLFLNFWSSLVFPCSCIFYAQNLGIAQTI